MTDATNQKTNELRDFEGHIYGAIVALLGAALLGCWGQTWAPVIAWVFFTVAMGTVLFLIVKVGDFIEKKFQS